MASPGMGGVDGGRNSMRACMCVFVKVYQERKNERKEGGGAGVMTQMRRTCADTVKLSHSAGSASLVLMFRVGRLMWECNYFHL